MERGVNSEKGQEIIAQSPILSEFIAGELTQNAFSAMGEYKRNIPGWESKVKITHLFAAAGSIYVDDRADELHRQQETLFFMGYEIGNNSNVNLLFWDIFNKLEQRDLINARKPEQRQVTKVVIHGTLLSGASCRQKTDFQDPKKEIPIDIIEFIEGLEDF